MALQLIASTGRTLGQSNPQPPPPVTTLTFELTEVPQPSTNVFVEGAPVLLQQIVVTAVVSGSTTAGDTITPAPPPALVQGTIAGSTPKVSANGFDLVRQHDQATVSGTVTSTSPSNVVTTPNVSVVVTVDDAGQSSVRAEGA